MENPYRQKLAEMLKDTPPKEVFTNQNEYLNYLAEKTENIYAELEKDELFPPGLAIHKSNVNDSGNVEVSLMQMMDISFFLQSGSMKDRFAQVLSDMLVDGYPYTNGFTMVTESWGINGKIDGLEDNAKLKEDLRKIDAGEMSVSESDFKVTLVTMMSCIEDTFYTLMYEIKEGNKPQLVMTKSETSPVKDTGGRFAECYKRFLKAVNREDLLT